MTARGGSPLARVLGKGSAHEGVHHWRAQRTTALAMVPLTLWFLFSILALPDLGFSSVTGWLSHPWSAVLACLLVVCVGWHSSLGVQVVIEDYVHGPLGFACLLANSAVHVLFVAAGVFAVLRIALTTVQ